MSMIGGSVLCFNETKTTVHILVIITTIFLTHAIRPFKDSSANDLVIMFAVVQFFGAISGDNMFLQLIFVLISFTILIIVGFTALRGAHASIMKQHELLRARVRAPIPFSMSCRACVARALCGFDLPHCSPPFLWFFFIGIFFLSFFSLGRIMKMMMMMMTAAAAAAKRKVSSLRWKQNCYSLSCYSCDLHA